MAQSETIPPDTRAPGYREYPDHRVAFVPSARRVRVTHGQLVIAETDDIIVVEEGNYPARHYIAREDIEMSLLQLVAGKSTFCPFKGRTAYYTLRTEGVEVTDVAWSYTQTYREAESIRDRICFDGTKVTIG